MEFKFDIFDLIRLSETEGVSQEELIACVIAQYGVLAFCANFGIIRCEAQYEK